AEVLAGAEGFVDHGAVLEPPQLGPHEGAALARLDVLELDDLPDLAVDLDVRAVLELVGADRHRGATLNSRQGPRPADQSSAAVLVVSDFAAPPPRTRRM